MNRVMLPVCLSIWTLAAQAATPAVVVSVTPETANVRIGATRDFNASVSNATDRSVDWFVNNVAGGNATVGTINSDGLYAPPAKVPSPNVVTIKGVSRADKTKSDTAAVTLLNAIPVISALDPAYVNVNLPAVILVNGSNFIPTAKVQVDGKPVTTKFVSDKQLSFSITSTAAPGTHIPITVLNPDPGAATSSARSLSVYEPVKLSVYPDKRTLRGGATQDFNASIANTTNKKVKWFVNGVAGGNATLGTIDVEGIYTAPMLLPTPASVTIKGVSEYDPAASDTSDVTLLNPIAVLTSVTPSPVKIGPATIVVKGTGIAKGAKLLLGGDELTPQWISVNEIRGTGNVAAPLGGVAAVVVVNPDPGGSQSNSLTVPVKPATEKMSLSAAVRFLEQASWGPTPASIAELQQLGADAWLDKQFSAPPSTYPDPADTSEGLSRLQKAFFANALTGQDQLRQRMAFALGQIVVVSGTEASRYHQMVPYQRLMMQYAFGNYGDLLREVTLNPTMGIYLDMVNNAKPDLKKNIAPNENYGRELLQLFSIGLFELNPDGTRKTDSSGNPIPSYTEDAVKKFSLAFTGWTFPPEPGFTSHWKNPPYFFGQMVPFDEQHDKTEKPLLKGVVLPANRTAQEDLTAALANIWSHPNVAPFISGKLIQHFTTSNPSPAYVGRVAAAFENTGGVKGNLKAVVRAILLDPEAGNGALGGPVATPAPDLAANQGHLREPVLFSLALLRALDAQSQPEPELAGQNNNMGQNLFFSPSVFNYFSPSYRIPGLGVTAPEFQILNPTTAMARANFVWRAVRNGLTRTITVDLSNLEGLAGDPNALLDAVSNVLLRGQMPAAMRTSISTAIAATNDRRTRTRIALFLAAVPGQYQVER
ncbi:MAG: DUF1800 family protein [Bryobacteraceae bacterium]